ncbi:g3713 [Coccomyxa viridis]|uniref:G3713 protein n=1 Tax=Coccomyxa viridis TaxID=1274662 RepID=A0ABP1FRT6_9CHLO
MSHPTQSPEMSHLSSCTSSNFCHIGYATRHARKLPKFSVDRKPFSQSLRSSKWSHYARETRRCGHAEQSGADSQEERQHLDQKLDAYAQQAAAADEAQFTAALADAQETKSRAGDSSTSSQQPRPAPSNAAPRSSSAMSMREAALAKLAKARQYAAANADAPSAAAAPAAAVGEVPSLRSQPSGNLPEQPQPVSRPSTGAAAWGKSAAGTSEQAAPFLQEVAQQQKVKQEVELSAEQFTLRKEQERRALGAEVITIDRDYAEKTGASGYKPKVATWGVFPRPANISKEFGGGRTLKPGEALETEEAKAARRKRVAEKLSSYKKEAGLLVDPVAEAAAQEAYNRGQELMREGKLQEANLAFDEAMQHVSFRSCIGGEVTLQKAICLDSLGRNEEAMPLYKLISRHSAPHVARSAKRLLFGFTAGDYLKAHTITYAVQKGAYDEYFSKLTGQYNNTWSAPEGENDAGSLRVAAVAATAVILTPLVLVGAKIGMQLMR